MSGIKNLCQVVKDAQLQISLFASLQSFLRQFAFGDIPVIDNDRFHDMIFDEIASHGFQCAIGAVFVTQMHFAVNRRQIGLGGQGRKRLD